jgi:hypothetical protein
MSAFTDRVVDLCQQEWQFFGRQTIDINGRRTITGMQETDEVFWQRVGVYWQAVGRNLTGRNADFPWSAAFVSYIMQAAGAGTNFRYSSAHSVYIRAAVRNRNSATASFRGFKPLELTLKVGDLVGYPRQNGVTYDNLPTDFKSHCDIVVAVRPNEIDVIGGNVGNSVTLKTLRTNALGQIVDTRSPWFVAIENRL